MGSARAGHADGRRHLRVLLASDFFHPHIGGAERQVRLLASALSRRGHEVRVVTAAQAGLPHREMVDDVPVERLRAGSTSAPFLAGDPGRRFLPPVPDPLLTGALARRVRRFRPDVVHANGWIAYSCAGATLGADTPLVLSVRDYGHACATRALLQDDRRLCSGPGVRKCLRCAGGHYGPAKGVVAVAGVFSGRPLLARTVSGVHSVSRYVEAALRRDLAHGSAWSDVRFERIPDVVTPPSSASLRPAEEELLARLPAQPFILFVGALQAHKGLLVLLHAYALLDRPPPLVLIGTHWPDTPEMPPGVTVLSDVPHAVVMAAWRRARFGVAPSVWPDPLPGVVREAMSAGRAIIGTRTGGIPDMVGDGVNGLLVEPGDVEGLADAMRRLLDDQALADAFGAAGRASLAALGPDSIAARFEAFYASLPGAGR